MFSVAASVGEACRVNGLPPSGMALDRPTADGTDRFDAVTVGWVGDETGVHEHAVNQPARATLSREDGRLEAWSDETDDRRGSE